MDRNSNRGVNERASTSREDPNPEPPCKKCRSETQDLPGDGQHSTMETSSIDTASSEQGNTTNTVSNANNEYKDCNIYNYQGGSHSQKTTPRANEKFEYCLPQVKVIGRDEEANELLKSVQTHRRVVIFGMSGIGKSSLAAQCARTWTFIRNAIFIDAETDDRVKSAFNSLGLTLDIQYFKDLEQSVKVERIYKTFKDTATLVIFDNVKFFDTIKAYLPPQSKDNFYVIITAQLREFENGFDKYDMPLMSKQSSLKIIESKFAGHWHRIEHEKKEIETLIEKMQSHPLAIIQAVAYISDQLMHEDSEYTVQKYLLEFDENFKNIEFADYWNDKYRYKSVYTALLMNVKMLEKDKDFEGKAETAFHCMAFLDPSRIKKDMFLYLCDSNDKPFNKVVRALRKYSLTGIETRWGEEYITIHRLIQHTIQCMLKEKETFKLVLRNTLKLLLISFSFFEHQHFIVPHMKDFKLSDFDQCYRELYSSGSCTEKLTDALRRVDYKFSVVKDWTAAHYAAFEQNRDMLELLKKRGQSFSVVSQQGWTVLHAHCLNRFANTELDYIIELEESNLNKQTRDKNTALHLLMKGVCVYDCYQYYRAFKLINNYRCDVKLTNENGDTVAHLAARNRHVQLLESPRVDKTKINNEGHSVDALAQESQVVIYRHTSQPPAEERVWYRCMHLKPLKTLKAGVKKLKHLVKGGGDMSEVYKKIVTLFDNIPFALKLAARYMRLKNITPTEFTQRFTRPPEHTVPSRVKVLWSGYYPTNICVLFCDVVNYLIEEHKCAFELLSYVSYTSHTLIEDELIDKGYSKNDIDAGMTTLRTLSLLDPDRYCETDRLFRCVTATYSQMRGEETAMCAAVIKVRAWNYMDHAVRVLGESGVLTAYREKYGSALAEVQEKIYSRTRGVKLLNVGDLDHWTALHWAVYSEQGPVVKELLLLGVSSDSVADDSITPLHLAVLHWETNIIKLLCEHSATVNARTAREGLTPLHLAAFGRNCNSPHYLISQGAKKNVRDSAGRTPYDMYNMSLPTHVSDTSLEMLLLTDSSEECGESDTSLEMLLPTDSSEKCDDYETSDEMSE